MSGGDKLQEKLRELSAKLSSAKTVRVGFLEGATYPPGDGGKRLTARSKTAAKDGHPEWEGLLGRWGAWEAEHPRDLSVAQVAFWNEYGTIHMCARPFMRTTIRVHSGEWGDDLKKYLKESDYDAQVSLTKIGIRIKDQIVNTIQHWPADNRPLTVYIKKFDHGLIDRGTMKNSVGMDVT